MEKETGFLFFQFLQLINIKSIFFFPATENKVNILVRFFLIVQKMRHRAERGNAGTGADQVNIFLDRLGQNKFTLRATQQNFRANRYLIKKIGST